MIIKTRPKFCKHNIGESRIYTGLNKDCKLIRVKRVSSTIKTITKKITNKIMLGTERDLARLIPDPGITNLKGYFSFFHLPLLTTDTPRRFDEIIPNLMSCGNTVEDCCRYSKNPGMRLHFVAPQAWILKY